MNHITDLPEDEIYDAIQTGEIPGVKIGDTINNHFLIVDSIGNYIETESGVEYFLFTETVRNNSTKETFTDRYVAKERCPYAPSMTHLEILSCESTKINLS